MNVRRLTDSRMRTEIRICFQTVLSFCIFTRSFLFKTKETNPKIDARLFFLCRSSANSVNELGFLSNMILTPSHRPPFCFSFTLAPRYHVVYLRHRYWCKQKLEIPGSISCSFESNSSSSEWNFDQSHIKRVSSLY